MTVRSTGNRILTAQTAAEIKFYLQRYSVTSVAKAYGVTRATVSAINVGKLWTSVEPLQEAPAVPKEGLRLRHLDWHDLMDVEILRDRGHSNEEIREILGIEVGVLRARHG